MDSFLIIVLLIALVVIGLGIWFAYKHGYLQHAVTAAEADIKAIEAKLHLTSPTPAATPAPPAPSATAAPAAPQAPAAK